MIWLQFNILVFVFAINGAHGTLPHTVQWTLTWIHNWASCCHVILTHVSTNIKDYGNQAWISDKQKVKKYVQRSQILCQIIVPKSFLQPGRCNNKQETNCKSCRKKLGVNFNPFRTKLGKWDDKSCMTTLTSVSSLSICNCCSGKQRRRSLVEPIGVST